MGGLGPSLGTILRKACSSGMPQHLHQSLLPGRAVHIHSPLRIPITRRYTRQTRASLMVKNPPAMWETQV